MLLRVTPLEWNKLLPFIIPLIILQLTVQIFALVDLSRQPASSIRGSKWVWILIILLAEIFGPIIYFLVAKKTE